ncbi:MAG: alcohol dehydrogenase catalytic domain-containing protein [Planctomycetota bacterium]|nr:alcohol dehydrogenase catalytic domain-containing protein [Planctomycetota bacterium]
MDGLYLESGALSLRTDLPAPEARPGWSRIQVLQAGICSTDQALARGYMNFVGVPGHEFVGVAVDGPLAGQRVVGEINASCGQCAMCRGGNPRHCSQRSVLGIFNHPGAFAESIALPDSNLFAVPDHVSDDAATFTEPLAAALHIADDVALQGSEKALVAGDGKLGLLCAWALSLHGCDVTVAGRHPERQALLPDGTRHATGWLEDSAVDEVDRGFDLAVEATGNPKALERLLPLLRPRGTIVLKTTTETPVTADLSKVVVDELRIVGSRCGPFAPAIAAIADQRIPVERLVSAHYPLQQGLEAFQQAAQPSTLKVLINLQS